MPDRTDWKRLIESYNFGADHIALSPTVAALERRKGGETGLSLHSSPLSLHSML